MDKYQVLKQYFGYEEFREGQEGLIDSILAGRGTLGIFMLSGAGINDEGNHISHIAINFSNAGSGICPEPGRHSCRVSEQLPDGKSIL